jgi:hypothetical protein
MNHAVPVGKCESTRNVAENCDGVPHARWPFAAQMNCERLTVDIGHDEIRHAVDFTCPEDADDVRVLKLRDCEYLAAEPAGGNAARHVRRQNLHDYTAVQLAIFSEVYARHPAAFELALEAVLLAQLGAEVFGDGLHAEAHLAGAYRIVQR